MKFEELKSVWALQQPAKAGTIDVLALHRALKARLNVRRRLLIIGGAGVVLGLILMQALFFLNLRVTRVEDQWLSFARLMLQQTVNLIIVLALVRGILRNRRLARGRAESVREVVSMSLENVEAEMADYRLGRWATPVLMAQTIVSLYLNELVIRMGWGAFGLRAGSVVAIYGLIGLLFWRQYHRKILPARERLQVTLQQLDNNPK